MDTNKTSISCKDDIAFPLTLSDALQLLATQKNINSKKAWRQLSERLDLIFGDFPKTRYRTLLTQISTEEFDMIASCLYYQLSEKRVKQILNKLHFIERAGAIYYIRYLDAPLSLKAVTPQWLNQKPDSMLKFDSFNKEVDKILYRLAEYDGNYIHEEKTATPEGVPVQVAIKLIIAIDELITKTYDYIKENYISPREIREPRLKGRQGTWADRHSRLIVALCNKDLSTDLLYNVEYADFHSAYTRIYDIYNQMVYHIDQTLSLLELNTTPILPEMQDAISNTITEISPLELEFFEYLLQVIPPRDKKQNISNQLRHGKWQILPIEVRKKIVNYIIQMAKQPLRLARFLNVDNSDEFTTIELLNWPLSNICWHIQEPHLANAYNDLESLYQDLRIDPIVLLRDNLDNISIKIAKIWRELQKAQDEIVQNK